MFIFTIVFAFCLAQTTLPQPTTTLPETTSDPMVYEAVFPDSLPIQGTITFTNSTDGLRIQVSLTHDDGASPNYPFHIHREYTSGDSGSTFTCDSAGGHYDPTNVDGNNYECLSTNIGACYRGDLSGKWSKLSFPSGQLFIDPTLSVEDLATETSIVIHANTGETSPARYVCASTRPQGSARGEGGDTLPGGANFVAAEASGGTVFLMTLIYILGFTFGIIAIYQIANGPTKEADKKLKRRLSKLGKFPSAGTLKNTWGVAPPPKRPPQKRNSNEEAKRDARFLSTDTTLSTATVCAPNMDLSAPPPSYKPGSHSPTLPPRPSSIPGPPSPAVPPRPPSNAPGRDIAPSTVSSIGGLPPIPSSSGPPKDDLGEFEKVDLPDKPVVMSENNMDEGYVDIQVNEDNLEDVNLC